MQIQCGSRREFLAGTVGAGVALAGARVHGSEDRGCEIRLGGRCFEKSDDPELMARWHVKRGYRAAYCPKQASLKDATGLGAIETSFAKNDVVIAEVGRWVNLMDRDPDKRRANLDTVTEGLALADAVGARCCVDIAGSHSEEHWAGPHPHNVSEEFFDTAVENARKIIDAVRPKRAKFCYEMMAWALPDSAESYLRMLKAIDREAYGVHLDPCNLINSPQRFWNNGAMIADCIEKLGPWIVSCHAKDMGWIMGNAVHFEEALPGTGGLDYAAYLRGLAKLDRQVPLMIEHLQTEDEYDRARKHLLGLGESLGVAFGY